MNRKDYDNLCIHGPGSPDRCGHPDCTGSRWVEVEEDWRRETPHVAKEGR